MNRSTQYPADKTYKAVIRRLEKKKVQCFSLKDFTKEESKLGEGAFATVQKVTLSAKPELGVVIKVMRLPSDSSPETKSSFLKCVELEAKTLNSLKHENIIKFIGIVQCPDVLSIHILLELAPNGDLHNVLFEQKNPRKYFSRALAVSWCLQIASALEYLHWEGKIHRDIKPDNMVLFNDFRLLKLTDFGSARELKLRMTTNLGSEPYMAPELDTLYRNRTYTEKTDIYSFGITIKQIFLNNCHYYNPRRFPPVREGFNINEMPRIVREICEKLKQKVASMRPSAAAISIRFKNFATLMGSETRSEMYTDETYDPQAHGWGNAPA